MSNSESTDGSHKDVITLAVGTGGTRVATEIFKQYSFEHNIDRLGNYDASKATGDNSSFERFFAAQQKPQTYKPRALFIEHSPSLTENTDWFQDARFVVHEALDQSHAIGNKTMDEVLDKLRQLIERSDQMEGFVIPYGIAGNFTSTVSPSLLQTLRDDHKKHEIHTIALYPSSQETHHHEAKVMNSILSFTNACKYQGISLALDNGKLREITRKYLSSYSISANNAIHEFETVNEYISKLVSGCTHNMRYDGSLNTSLTEMRTNLVPYPSLHHCIASYAPIIPQQHIIEAYCSFTDVRKRLLVNGYHRRLVGNRHIVTDINEVIYQRYCEYFECDAHFQAHQKWDDLTTISLFVFERDAFSIKAWYGKWMAVCLHFRGDVVPKDVEHVVGLIKTKRTIEFVDWCPTGFKVGMNYCMPSARKGEHCLMDARQRDVAMIGNSVCFIEMCERILTPFMDAVENASTKKRYLRQYEMEESELIEITEAIHNVRNEYEEAFATQDVDESSDF